MIGKIYLLAAVMWAIGFASCAVISLKPSDLRYAEDIAYRKGWLDQRSDYIDAKMEKM